MSEVRRQLKIKTGSVKRLAKELLMYTKDKDVETTRVENLRAAKGDASDIKHAVSLLSSSGEAVAALHVTAYPFSVTTGASASRGSNDDSGHKAKVGDCFGRLTAMSGAQMHWQACTVLNPLTINIMSSLSSGCHCLLQTQSEKAKDSEEYLQAKQVASEAEQVLA